MKTTLLITVVLTLAWWIGARDSVAGCSDHPGATRCEDFDSNNFPTYGFDGWCWGDGCQSWTRQHHDSGGIGNSGHFTATAVNLGQDNCYFEIDALNDGDFFWRGCWKFTDGWEDYGLVDQKLTYFYAHGGQSHHNLFLHAGWSGAGWSGRGLELGHYQIPGDFWVPANDPRNEIRHTNYLVLADHLNEWICIEGHVDIDQNPWVFTYWVSTEDGQYDDYEYLRFRHSAPGQTLSFMKYGAFINENAGRETMSLDEFVLSNTKIGPPPELNGGGIGSQPDTVSGLERTDDR